MEYISFLLPILVLYPCIISRLSRSFPSVRSSYFLFVGPICLLALTLIAFYGQGPVEFKAFDNLRLFSVGLKLDVLSGVIATTVLTIGTIVTRYSIRFLEDDPKLNSFINNLSLTLSFVLTMLMSPNLVILFLSWIGTSFYLHKLLLHFSNSPGAIKASSQKFIISRIGDVFILSAGLVLFFVFNSLEFDVIFDAVSDPSFVENNSFLINISAIFLVLGAMTKSAQFPFHYWLPNTMETPTPVSALMHAGIINAGGYLVVRMSPLLSHAPLSLSILAIVGGGTAFFASIIMFTQSNVKKSLAYSTIAQMGFMMLQCGLGAFSMAVVHIIGHAFYKAYAFLSSSSSADIGRLNRYFPKQKIKSSFWSAVTMAFASIIIVFGTLLISGYDILDKPGVSVLILVLSLAAAQIILSSNDKIKASLTALATIGMYLVLGQGMGYLLLDIVSSEVHQSSTSEMITLLLCSSFFVGLYLIQNNLEKISQTNIGKKIYVKALRGAI